MQAHTNRASVAISWTPKRGDKKIIVVAQNWNLTIHLKFFLHITGKLLFPSCVVSEVKWQSSAYIVKVWLRVCIDF